MKNKTNFPGFTAESTLSHNNEGYNEVTAVPNTNNSIIPQLWGGFFPGLVIWAGLKAAYAGCWWACVVDGNGAVSCKNECETLIF